MDWNEKYTASRQPTMEQIREFIGIPMWDDLCRFIENTYGADPILAYSSCTMQPGWNIKYRKSSKPICTLYPVNGFFICMVSIGARAATEAELFLPACTPYVQSLNKNCAPFNGSRWLMINVTDELILADAMELIRIRMSVK